MQDENNRSGSNSSRPSSAFRHPRRGMRETGRGKEDGDKHRSDSMPSSAAASTGEKSEERKPQKQQRDDKDRVRNKDRPAQAIYQPRSRPARGNGEETSPRTSGRQPPRESGKGFRNNMGRDRDNLQRSRDSPARDRDYRENNRRPNRESQKTPRGKPEDSSKE